MFRFRRNSRDRILDACLSEVVGGHRPPDLSDRILRKMGGKPPRRRSGLLFVAIAASMLVVAVGFLFARLAKERRPDNVAGKSDGDPGVVVPQPGKRPESVPKKPVPPRPKSEKPKPNAPLVRPTPPDKTVVAKSDPRTPGKGIESPKGVSPKVTLVASSEAAILGAVNTSIRDRWKDEGVTPAAHATDAEWCRRVYLDLIGRIPTYEENTAFTSDRSRDKKQKLVDQLMNSEEYVEEFARNWTTVWTNLLLGRDADDRNGMVNREGFQQFVRRAFLTNKRYDKFVYELLTATGSNKPGDEDFNGAVTYLLDNLEENATSATSKTARIFLGMQVQCTQCHNHPFNDWKQNQFWELNAFFRQARPQRQGRGRDAGVRLVNATFRGEDTNGDPREAAVYYEQRNRILRVAYPVFVDGTKISPSGLIEEVNRREELAKLLVKSEYFSQAIVNRMWSHFLGYGFTKPVDDMGPHRTPSHPEVLSRLAKEFVAHRHDLRKLFRWITLSEPYALSSRAAPKSKKADDPEAGNPPLFARFYMRQMRAEELYESLLVATHADSSAGSTKASYSELESRKNRWLQQFTMAYDNDENDEATTFNGTIPQTLMMWNGSMISKATSADGGTFLQRIARSKEKPSTKINQLFMAALGRRPSKGEIDMANRLWRARKGDTVAALQDIWWVLLNSGEFILNH